MIGPVSPGAFEEPVDDTPREDGQPAYELQEAELLSDNLHDEEEIPPRSSWRDWLPPILLGVMAAGWTAFFIFANWAAMQQSITPAGIIDWVVTWSIPLTLLIAIYLLTRRHSRREAIRFGDTARALGQEVDRMESRLFGVNRELSLAREFLASQSQDLESLGRLAAERLTGSADHLSQLVTDNAAQVETIGTVSDTAVANLEMLRSQLPVLTNAARDMSNQIGGAGNAAQAQIEELESSFARLHELEKVGNAHAENVRTSVEGTLISFEERLSLIANMAEGRFTALRGSSDALDGDLRLREEQVFDALATRSETMKRQFEADGEALRASEAQTLAAMRDRVGQLRAEGERVIGAIGAGHTEIAERWKTTIAGLDERMREVIAGVSRLDENASQSARSRLATLKAEAEDVDARLAQSLAAFAAEVGNRRRNRHAADEEELSAFAARLAEFDRAMAERQDAHADHVAGVTQRAQELADRLTALDAQMSELRDQADNTAGVLSVAATDLSGELANSRTVVTETTEQVERLTDDSVRLLEIIRAAAEHSNADLAQPLETAQARLAELIDSADQVRTNVERANQDGATLLATLEEAGGAGVEERERLSEITERLTAAGSEARALADRVNGEISDAATSLLAGSDTAFDDLRRTYEEAVGKAIDDLRTSGDAALARAIDEHSTQTLSQLEEGIVRTRQEGSAAADELQARLTEIERLTAQLEERAARARQEAEEQAEHEFGRRTAMITDALNSTAIDIAKVFDNDIGDVEWANYLKGDRGIFTRRAVRLLDRQDARRISEVYESDADFRDTVNRYVHDFEAMLRSVLSTRNGNAIAIPLLSSDMGKLYVALAQGIDRLRG